MLCMYHLGQPDSPSLLSIRPRWTRSPVTITVLYRRYIDVRQLVVLRVVRVLIIPVVVRTNTILVILNDLLGMVIRRIQTILPTALHSQPVIVAKMVDLLMLALHRRTNVVIQGTCNLIRALTRVLRAGLLNGIDIVLERA